MSGRLSTILNSKHAIFQDCLLDQKAKTSTPYPPHTRSDSHSNFHHNNTTATIYIFSHVIWARGIPHMRDTMHQLELARAQHERRQQGITIQHLICTQQSITPSLNCVSKSPTVTSQIPIQKSVRGHAVDTVETPAWSLELPIPHSAWGHDVLALQGERSVCWSFEASCRSISHFSSTTAIKRKRALRISSEIPTQSH
jgi:hypothetical protein